MSDNKILQADWLTAYPAFVIVKWDGVRFSTRFYQRIKAINAEFVNAPAKVEKIVSGVYGCVDEQVARLLSNIADEYGALSVIIIQGTAKPFIFEEQDAVQADVFQSKLRKAGRPKKKEKK